MLRRLNIYFVKYNTYRTPIREIKILAKDRKDAVNEIKNMFIHPTIWKVEKHGESKIQDKLATEDVSSKKNCGVC